MSGFVKLHRGWQDSDLFKDNEPYCERAAWCWLLSNAAWKNINRVGPQGDLIEVREGEFHTSLRSLAKAWNWDKNKVSRFIKRATTFGNIGTSAGQAGLHITICNWGKYQGLRDKHEPESGTSAGQARDTQEEGIRRDKKKETTSNEVVVALEPFPKIECANSELWRDFMKNRKTKRLPNTPTAHAKLVRDLAAMAARLDWPPGKVFEACVAKGWGAIYDPRDESEKQNGRNNGNSGSPTINANQRVKARLAASADCNPASHNGPDYRRIEQKPDVVRAIGYEGR